MVDILLASYNGENFIAQQFNSILAQTCQDFRILVRDDNSSDRTLSIIREYETQYPDKVIPIIDDIKCGSSVSNFMQLTKSASSEYVMYCDQDDVWLPDKIKVTLDKMQELERQIGKDKPILVFADYKMVDHNLNEFACNASGNQVAAYHLEFNRLLVQNYVTGCLMMVNKALYEKMGDYDEAILMHDWWAALMACAMGAICHIPKTVMLYRQHGNNVVGAVNVKSMKYRMNKLLDANTKNAKYLYEKQARLFLSRYAEYMEEDCFRQLKDFLAIMGYSSKWKRMAALKNGNFLKSDKVRQIGQLWYI